MPNNDLHVQFRRAEVAETVRIFSMPLSFSYLKGNIPGV